MPLIFLQWILKEGEFSNFRQFMKAYKLLWQKMMIRREIFFPAFGLLLRCFRFAAGRSGENVRIRDFVNFFWVFLLRPRIPVLIPVCTNCWIPKHLTATHFSFYIWGKTFHQNRLPLVSIPTTSNLAPRTPGATTDSRRKGYSAGDP